MNELRHKQGLHALTSEEFGKMLTNLYMNTLSSSPLSEDIVSKKLTPLQVFAKESLKHLTARQRVIWLMQTEFNQDQIAKRLGISQSAVAQHLMAAAQRIKRFGKQYKQLFNKTVATIPIEDISFYDSENWKVLAQEAKTPVRRENQNER